MWIKQEELYTEKMWIMWISGITNIVFVQNSQPAFKKHQNGTINFL